MRPEEIEAHRRKQPFCRLRLHGSDGSSYDIRHPEFMLVTHREITIALDPGTEDLPERSVYLDPLHVTRVELIDGAEQAAHA